MSLSKERRDDIRLWINGYNVPAASEHEMLALLDMADERDRYRALLTVAASVLSEDGDTTEADARALYRRITAALEGKE